MTKREMDEHREALVKQRAAFWAAFEVEELYPPESQFKDEIRRALERSFIAGVAWIRNTMKDDNEVEPRKGDILRGGSSTLAEQPDG